MSIYQVSPDHQLARIEGVFLLWLRVVCTCGWKTGVFWNPNKAANAFFLHQAETGTPLPDTEGQ